MSDGEKTVVELLGELERSWNAADGGGFARPFTDDADFVNIRGEHHRGRVAIAKGHEAILASIYKGSSVHMEVDSVRSLAPGVQLAHVKSTLNVPAGPLAGTHHAMFSMVLTQEGDDWRIAAFHNTLVAA